MSGTMTETPFDLTAAVRNLITEDDEPVDNILSEKQQRLLVDALYESWTPPPAEDVTANVSAQPRPFWAAANVGIFRSVHLPGIAPDVFISLDVSAPADLRTTEQLSYFMWEHGKPPEVVLEIVSNRKGKELDSKRRDYAQMGVTYYVVYDPFHELERELGGEELHVYELGFGKRYRRRADYQLPEVGLSLTLWEGRFEDSDNQWLRWCDAQGKLLLTGHERAAAEADARRQAEDRAARLAAKLRELGVEPEQL
jgi:Uma2 family endonuclease